MKFTPERRATLVCLFNEGLTMREAASEAEVTERTLKGWLARGRRESSGTFHDFAAAVDGAREHAAAREKPMDEAELRLVVSRAARRGSVQAQKLYWEMIRADDDEAEAQPPKTAFEALDEGDELAQRRARAA